MQVLWSILEPHREEKAGLRVTQHLEKRPYSPKTRTQQPVTLPPSWNEKGSRVVRRYLSQSDGVRYSQMPA